MATVHEAPLLIGLCDGVLDKGKGSSSFLTNKIGDLPDKLPVISWQHPSCGLCNGALSHVVQVYCPLEASPYHRTLNLFVCTSPQCCGKPESWRALRSQCLESDVKAASVLQLSSHIQTKEAPIATTDWCDGADDWGMEDEGGHIRDIALTHAQPQVQEEGAHSDTFMPPTTELDVSVRLQGLSLRAEEDTKQKVATFCSFYISVVEETDLIGQTDLEHAQRLLKEYEKREGVAVGELDSTEGGGGEKYEKTKARHGDTTFSRFMKKISLCPEQVLRYCWNGSPLFISDPPSNMAQMVPVCCHCGSPRIFEFQLMPALVSLLRSSDSSSEMVMEFGIVLVYTCRSSCWKSGSSSPVEEFIFIQADPDQKLFK